MRKLAVTASHSWSRSSISNRPIPPRLGGFRNWFSHPRARIRFLSEHGKARAEYRSTKDRSPGALRFLVLLLAVAAKCPSHCRGPSTRWAWKGVGVLRLRRAIRFALDSASLGCITTVARHSE